MTGYMVQDPDGTLVQLDQWQDDVFDDGDDRVFREVSFYQDCLLGRSHRDIDDVLSQVRDVIRDADTEDGLRVKLEVTVGDLRRLNTIAGLMAGEVRVRNPDIGKLFKQPNDEAGGAE